MVIPRPATSPCDISLLCDYTDTDSDGCSTAGGARLHDPTPDLQPQATDGDPGYNGCINPAATNFGSDANTDDGSCQFEVVFRVNASNIEVAGHRHRRFLQRVG